MEKEKINIQFSFDYWILNVYAILQIVVDQVVTKGNNEKFSMVQGLAIISVTLLYAAVKIIYLTFKNK